uniref:(California timema) hypothetical protein n=1 Tax=Timema californicum TaxID=61474 RepID=A0A7R9JE62_TIMCA|nr:unnamed protein product [Timema californicum]
MSQSIHAVAVNLPPRFVIPAAGSYSPQCSSSVYSSPVASLVLTDSSQLTSDSQHLEFNTERFIDEVKERPRRIWNSELRISSRLGITARPTVSTTVREQCSEIQLGGRMASRVTLEIYLIAEDGDIEVRTSDAAELGPLFPIPYRSNPATHKGRPFIAGEPQTERECDVTLYVLPAWLNCEPAVLTIEGRSVTVFPLTSARAGREFNPAPDCF